jgi:predicted nuclease of predicted toxin-antitoxin system
MIGFYFDEHMSRLVAKALIRQKNDVVMAVDVSMTGKPDEEHLAYASEHNLVMVTFDRPFAGRTGSRTDFLALICLANDIRDDVGQIIQVLVEFVELFDLEKDRGQVFWLP